MHASPPAELRRRRDPEATRKAILDAAEELFVAQGPAQTPTSQVARQAGVTKSLIHHHFSSKDELWQAVKRRRFAHYHQVQKAMLLGSEASAELIRESLVAYFRFLASDRSNVRFMCRRFVEENDPCLDLEEELFELAQQKIREAQAKGELRPDVDPISIIKMILALPFYWFESRTFLCQMLGPDEDPVALDERFLADMQKIILDGLKTATTAVTATK